MTIKKRTLPRSMLSQVDKFATEFFTKRDKLIVIKGDKGDATFILGKDGNNANKMLSYNSMTKEQI